VYGGSNDCLLYLETGWQKEAWCDVLRASAKLDNGTENWYYKLKEEYHEYLLRVEKQFPFLRGLPQGSLPRSGDDNKSKLPKSEMAALTKKRLLWKKLTRRSIKAGKEKSNGDDSRRALSSDEAEDGSSRGASVGSAALGRTGSLEDISIRESGPDDDSPSLVRTPSNIADTSQDRDGAGIAQSEGLEASLFVVNRLFSRVFFDIFHSERIATRIRTIVQARFP
jgi:hypothetical protein